jgi:hypothetical protein
MGNNFAHTLRDKSRLETAESCGFREVTASQSKMIGNSDVIRSAVFCGFAGIRFDLPDVGFREPAARGAPSGFRVGSGH